MARDAKSIELASQKAAYIGELLKEEPKLTLRAVRQKIEEKFKSLLNFKRARAEFIAAGGKVRAKHTPKRPGRKKPIQSAQPRRPIGRPPKSAKQIRGPGRRADDQLAAQATAALRKFEPYLVLVNTQDQPRVHSFATKLEAAGFVGKQLCDGVPVTSLATYSRDSLPVKLDV